MKINFSRAPFLTLVLLALLHLAPQIVRAQQPFYTDDADVTARHKFHFEFSNEFDILQRSSFPNLRQNTADFELNYGLIEGVEVSIESPLITIFNAPGTTPRIAFGIGDTNFAVKYNFKKERDGSRWPALTINLNAEVPTGNVDLQLGSGLADVWLNGIVQKSLTDRTTLRFNAGLLFSGNQTTGVIGIKARGAVFTYGTSVVRAFTPKLKLGAEITGAYSREVDLGKGQLQALIGGNYILKEGLSFDFGVVSGRYDASPRFGVQVGISMDF